MEEIKNGKLEETSYYSPIIDVYYLDKTRDILCMSNESNDNEFGAGGLGGFVDNNGN